MTTQNCITSASVEVNESQKTIRLGWQCGYAYAGFYPESTQEQQQQAAQNDAKQLVCQTNDWTFFLAAWEQGVRAALAMRGAEHGGICPSCGQEDAILSHVVLLVGQATRAGQVTLVPQRLCFSCATLDPEQRFTRSLSRPVQTTTAIPSMVLSLLVSKDHPTHLVAEQVASTFPFVTDSLVMHAVEGQVATLCLR